MKHPSKWFIITIVNFFIAACFGALMRYAFVSEINWVEYRNVLHAHSHVAMLGWLYLALFILLLHFFIKDYIDKKHYRNLFLWTQVSVLGMAIAFPIEGYTGASIFFSTLHVILSYVFVLRFLKDLKTQGTMKTMSALFVKTALGFMVLSTLALFVLAVVMNMDLDSGIPYFMSVQFFLHFQFNGWFIFAILALFFRMAEEWNISFTKILMKRFYWALVISCFLTYALAVTWSTPSPLLFFVNSLGVLLQLFALLVFLRLLKRYYAALKEKMHRAMQVLFTLAFFSFCIKIIVQAAVVIPFLGEIAYTVRNYVIGFIHLILLACITFAIFSFATRAKFIAPNHAWVKNGITLLTIGIICSEVLLFVQGTMLWHTQGFIPYYYEIIFGISMLMPVGVAILFMGLLSPKHSEQLLN